MTERELTVTKASYTFRAMAMGFAALRAPMGNMSNQDLINIGCEDGASKIKALENTSSVQAITSQRETIIAVSAMPSSEGRAALNGSCSAKAQLPAAENLENE